MKQLILLRHGKTVANEKKQYCGWTDSPLCKDGIEALQAKKCSCRYPALKDFAVYTSDLYRTEQTLEQLYGDVPHIREPAFRETNFGDFEGRTYAEMLSDPRYLAWMEGDNIANVCPNGESSAQMGIRVNEALAPILAQHDKVCLVTHGGVIGAIMMEQFPEENKLHYKWQPDNGCGYLVCLDEHRYVSLPFEKPHWENKHYSFTQNRDCEFFPCHTGVPEEEFNCLFCYCPLYALGRHCGGNCVFTKSGIKDCGNCTLPHKRNSYGYINRRFGELTKLICENNKKESLDE